MCLLCSLSSAPSLSHIPPLSADNAHRQTERLSERGRGSLRQPNALFGVIKEFKLHCQAKCAEAAAATAKESEAERLAEAVQGWAEAQFVATLSSALPQSSHTHTNTYIHSHTQRCTKRAKGKARGREQHTKDKSQTCAAQTKAQSLLAALPLLCCRR